MEWKVARTNLMAGYMTNSVTLPPPFNLVPTLRMVRNWISSGTTTRKRTCRCKEDGMQRCYSDHYKATVRLPWFMIRIKYTEIQKDPKE